MQHLRISAQAHMRLVAPSRAVSAEELDQVEHALAARGFSVSTGAHVRDRWHSELDLAGVDQDRAQDLIEALRDPDVDVVVALRGGYGAMRILPWLEAAADLSFKPILGFSDVTALHHWAAHRGWWSLHGPLGLTSRENESADRFWRLMVEGAGTVSDNPLTSVGESPAKPLRAPWHGGNLALVAALAGTPYQPAWDGAVLYLEEVHEAPYRIDRMLQQLALSGILSKIRGLVFGCAVLGDQDLEPVVRELLEPLGEQYGIPVWTGLESGHREPMWTIPLGWPLVIDPDGRVRVGEAKD